MSKDIKDVDVLQEYIKRIKTKAKHHAEEVGEVIFPLIGAIVWKCKDIKCLEIAGDMKNVLWISTTKNKRYAFSYNHAIKKVEMREGGIKGKVLNTFDNKDTIAGIIQIFSKL
jgi:hypothetical protein